VKKSTPYCCLRNWIECIISYVYLYITLHMYEYIVKASRGWNIQKIENDNFFELSFICIMLRVTSVNTLNRSYSLPKRRGLKPRKSILQSLHLCWNCCSITSQLNWQQAIYFYATKREWERGKRGIKILHRQHQKQIRHYGLVFLYSVLCSHCIAWCLYHKLLQKHAKTDFGSKKKKKIQRHEKEYRRIPRTSVPDPKLLITDPGQDPNPQIENQKFQIRILPKITHDDKKFVICCLFYSTHRLNLYFLYIFSKFCIWDNEEFGHLLFMFKRKLHFLGKTRGWSGSGFGSEIDNFGSGPDHWDQMITDPDPEHWWGKK